MKKATKKVMPSSPTGWTVTGVTFITRDQLSLVFRGRVWLHYTNIDESELKLVASSIVNCIQNLGSDPTGMANPHIALGVTYSNKRKPVPKSCRWWITRSQVRKRTVNLIMAYVTADDHGAGDGKQQWREAVEEVDHQRPHHLPSSGFANNAFGKTYHQECVLDWERRCSLRCKPIPVCTRAAWNMSHILDQYVIEDDWKA